MDLHQLRYLLAVAKQKSMTRAAEGIPVRVSAVSQAISELEKELGVALFVRSRRGVQLTLAGELLVEHVEQALAQLDTAKQRLSAYRGVRSSVTLGTLPIEGVLKLPDVLAAFRRDYPSIEVRLLEGTTRDLVASLRTRQVDIALLTGPPGSFPIDLDTLEIDRAETGVVLTPNHPLVTNERIELASLAETPLITLTPGHTMREITMEVCERAGIRPPIAFETTVSEMLSALVRAGIGFSISTRRRAIETGLAYVRCIPSPQDRVVAVGWLHGRRLSPEAELLRDRMRGGWA